MKKKEKEITYTRPKSYFSVGVCEKMLDATHVLISGTAGSGKSVLIEDFIYTIMAKYTPHEARIFCIDPKEVTFIKYRHLPFVEQIETENGAIIDLLKNMIETMEKRYLFMRERGLVQYEGKHIYIIIDELADLMTTAKKEVMPLLQRLAQKGRAANIHLICATQCPNRTVIPAQLTVNFGARVALRCIDPIESRQVIKRKGAELLPRYGKCIYLHSDGIYYTCAIPLLTDRIDDLIKFWLAQGNNDDYFVSNSLSRGTATKNRVSFWSVLHELLLGGSIVHGNSAPSGTLPKAETHKIKSRDDFDTLNVLSIIDND